MPAWVGFVVGFKESNRRTLVKHQELALVLDQKFGHSLLEGILLPL